MKTSYFRLIVIVMVVTVLFGSCKKENENQNATIFKASIEQGNGNVDGRTYLDPVDNIGYVKWSAGDQFKVAETTGGTTATFTLVEGQEGIWENAQFICHGFDMEPPYTAAYPAANVTAVNNGTVNFSLPATQTMTATGTFGNGTCPMVGTADNLEISFKNVCGGLGFPLKGAGAHVTGLRLTSNKTTESLWGDFTVSNCGDDEPTLTYVSGGSNVLEIACDVTLTDEAQWFYFILPPGTLSEGFKVEVLIGNIAVLTQTTSNSLSVTRNTILGLDNAMEVAALEPGPFSVSSTQQVWFSPGNLQYMPSADRWRFAEHQCDFIGSDNTLGSPTYTGWIDLLGANLSWPTTVDNNDETGWRMMSREEWSYLYARTVTVGDEQKEAFGHANVNGVNGLILLPDNWNACVCPTFVYGNSSWSNVFSESTTPTWSEMESVGVVFLPAAGELNSSNNSYNWDIDEWGDYGGYWSTTPSAVIPDGWYSYSFRSESFTPYGFSLESFYWISVRLVLNVELRPN